LRLDQGFVSLVFLYLVDSPWEQHLAAWQFSLGAASGSIEAAPGSPHLAELLAAL